MSGHLAASDFRPRAAPGRYDRQTLIPWWDQERLAAARALVVGAGALGNEVLKSLALMGVGRTLVYDLDAVELSNLSRGVLFRDGDVGAHKAAVAARRMAELNPEVRAVGRTENVLFRAGLGVFLWADVVICAVDNREARLFVNAACARLGRPWVDGGIEGLSGVVRVFDPAAGACYECTMNETDRRLVAERRSCAMLARRAAETGSVPATAVAASVVGALQAAEAIHLLHGRSELAGEGLFMNGSDFSRVRFPRRDDCYGHDSWGEVEPLGAGAADLTVGELLERAARELGGEATVDFSRDLVLELRCPECGAAEPGRAVVGEIGEERAGCPACGAHRGLEIASSAYRGGPVDLGATPAELGVPPFDVVLARRGLAAKKAWLFDADAPAVLGALAGEPSGVSA